MPQLSKYEAATVIGMSPELLDWFASYSPKQGDTKKLASSRDKFGVTTFSTDDLKDWDKFLNDPWPEVQRQPPLGIERELFLESQGKCMMCQNFVVCEMAHIDPWEETFNHHPHNLVHLCPTCHTRVDRTKEIPRAVVRQKKQELIDRRAQDWRLAAKNHADLLSAPLSQSRDESVQILANITFNNAVMQNPKIGEDFVTETGFANITSVPLDHMNSAVRMFGDIYSRYFPTAGSNVSVITALLSRKLSSASEEVRVNASGFREGIVKGRLKYAADCLKKGEEECRKFVSKIAFQRVRKPELMGAPLDTLEVEQMELLSRYRDQERELDQYVDQVVSGNEVAVLPNIVVGRYKHRLIKLDEALNALIRSLS